MAILMNGNAGAAGLGGGGDNSLATWLAHCERLHPTAIEMGLERVKAVAQRLNLSFKCPVITVAGTNGKGSTCAMLEAVLSNAGYRVGVYTSPHLVHFEERCRMHGANVEAADLLPHFAAIEQARSAGALISLSYFEFTTLVILRCLAHANLDAVILEVGLGGRLDATNMIDADCAIITSIALDHTDLLGNDRESIGFEKAAIMRSGKPAIVGDPAAPKSVLAYAQKIGAELWQCGVDFNFSGDKLQWNWAGRGRRYAGLAYPALRGANQLFNAAGVLAALESLRAVLPVTAQAVRNGWALVQLPARFQIVPGEPVLVLDAAHNPHSVAALAENLDAMGFYPVTHAIFGAMADKDLATMLERIGPIIDRWYFTDLPTARAESALGLQAQCQTLLAGKDLIASVHASPQDALQAAIVAANPADRIVVFGSFFTVGEILAHPLPSLHAKHLVS